MCQINTDPMKSQVDYRTIVHLLTQAICACTGACFFVFLFFFVGFI
jgi:hypothetical protein